MATQPRKFHLSTIELATDVSTPQVRTPGTICLTRNQDTFSLSWAPLDGSPSQRVAAVFQSLSLPTGDDWSPGKPFLCDCRLISLIEFSEDPLSISITRSDHTEVRRFQLPNTEFISLAMMVEQLLVNGIAVPGTKSEYCVEFYSQCHRGVYTYTPPHIQLSIKEFTSLSDFWSDVHSFFERLLIHLDASDTLPRDQDFPLATAARAAHKRLMRTVEAYVDGLPQYERVTSVDGLFDSDGRVSDKQFKERLYHSGADKSVMPTILPFVVGMFDLDSTTEQREALEKELDEEFQLIRGQVRAMCPHQTEHNKRVHSTYRVIVHDVTRTDRHMAAFKNLQTIGPVMLTEFLKMYSIYNPPLGYLQGMNDLFVPIITAYVPNWRDDGTPIDENGNERDLEPLMPKLFWCFEAMLKNTDQLSLLANVTEHCKLQALRVHQIMTRVLPIGAIWMRRRGLQELLWCYSDFVLMFKRTYQDVWQVWLKFNCSPRPSQWLTYFMAAIILCSLDQLTLLPDVAITAMMDSFPKILDGLDVNKIGKVALWLFNEARLPENVVEDPGKIETAFSFFETGWSTKCD